MTSHTSNPLPTSAALRPLGPSTNRTKWMVLPTHALIHIALSEGSRSKAGPPRMHLQTLAHTSLESQCEVIAHSYRAYHTAPHGDTYLQ